MNGDFTHLHTYLVKRRLRDSRGFLRSISTASYARYMRLTRQPGPGAFHPSHLQTVFATLTALLIHGASLWTLGFLMSPNAKLYLQGLPYLHRVGYTGLVLLFDAFLVGCWFASLRFRVRNPFVARLLDRYALLGILPAGFLTAGLFNDYFALPVFWIACLPWPCWQW